MSKHLQQLNIFGLSRINPFMHYNHLLQHISKLTISKWMVNGFKAVVISTTKKYIYH